MNIEFTLNGKQETFDVEKSDLLLDVLRQHGYTGSKRGCDTGACGFCTVLIDGEPENSCVTPVMKVEGSEIETIEGLGTQDDLHPVQQAFVNRTSLQCGFCIPGMIMSAKALLEENPDPTKQEVRDGLEDNLCRCTGYKKIVEAVMDASEMMNGEVAADGGWIDADEPTGTRSCGTECCNAGDGNE